MPQKKTVDIQSTVYRCVNGSPDQNMRKLVDLMGGMEKPHWHRRCCRDKA